jgi:hypothetical protein
MTPRTGKPAIRAERRIAQAAGRRRRSNHKRILEDIPAVRTGRTGYGIDLDPVYVDTSVRRWQRFAGKTAVHACSGRSFAGARRGGRL